MSLTKRPKAEVHVIEQLVKGIKDIPNILNERGFDGTRLLINALLFVAARYAIHYKRHNVRSGTDWSVVKDEVMQQFEQDLEEQFSYYYGIEA